MAIPWPWQVIPRSSRWALSGASRSGGRSVTGSEQVVRSDAGFWTVRYSIDVFEEDRILAWRAFVTALDGRAGVALVPVFDLYTGHDVNGRRLPFYDAAALSGSGLFDHSGFGQLQTVQATLAAPAALGATTITVSAASSWQAPRPGGYFTIDDRLYRVISAVRVGTSDPWTVRFRPRLRAAAPSGVAVVTDRMVCRMRLAEDDMAEPDLELGYLGQVEVEFVEAV